MNVIRLAKMVRYLPTHLQFFLLRFWQFCDPAGLGFGGTCHTTLMNIISKMCSSEQYFKVYSARLLCAVTVNIYRPIHRFL